MSSTWELNTSFLQHMETKLSALVGAMLEVQYCSWSCTLTFHGYSYVLGWWSNGYSWTQFIFLLELYVEKMFMLFKKGGEGRGSVHHKPMMKNDNLDSEEKLPVSINLLDIILGLSSSTAWGLWCKVSILVGSCRTEFLVRVVDLLGEINILIMMTLVDQEWRLPQHHNWQRNTIVAMKDKEVALQEKDLKENAFSTFHTPSVSKGGVAVKSILSQACVISGKEGEKEQNAHAISIQKHQSVEIVQIMESHVLGNTAQQTQA